MTATSAEQKSAAPQAQVGKYLTFKLGTESYGVPVLKIREIIRLTPVTPVPQAPAHVRGVINLRGKIIPVVDLRLKFGFPRAEASERTCIVVVQVRAGANEIQLGLQVDDVEEVVQIASRDVEDAPDFGSTLSGDCLLGLAKLKNKVVILLDIDEAIGGEFLGERAATL